MARRILGYKKLKTHYGKEGILYCMASKSDNYSGAHLTMNIKEVTCGNCLRLLNSKVG